jgi:tripartite-type tricarboxylate transporter receptor subunit TctC
MNRKTLLHLAAALAVCYTTLAPSAIAQMAAWPGSTLKIIVPSPPGVGSDLFARQYAEALAKSLGVAVVVENKPGAALTIAANLVAKSPPDGLTVLFSPSNPLTISPFLMARLPYNAQKDLQPVMQSARGGSFILGNNVLAATDLRGLVALAKASPGKLNFATYGPGSTAHIGLELLQDAAGIDMLNVPYKTSAIPDLIGGQVNVSFEPPASAIAQIKAGKVKALAYTGSKRNPAMPDVPTMAEAYPGLEMPSWIGVWVAAGTPPAIVQRLHAEFAKATHTAEVTRRLLDNGLEPAITTPEETAALIQREAEAMGRIIKAKNIKLE